MVSYRLGPLGFAAFREDGHAGTGNYGTHDILTAAAWLKREARSLGANPDRIIAFGESSGATDAQVLTSKTDADPAVPSGTPHSNCQQQHV